jgi:hypothetical protein
VMAGADGTVLTDDEAARYRRGSAALREGAGAVDVARLKSAFEETQQRLIPALEALGAVALATDVPERFRRPPLLGTVGQALVRLSYHEGYHNGQIGLLRRVAGKESASNSITDSPSASARRAPVTCRSASRR